MPWLLLLALGCLPQPAPPPTPPAPPTPEPPAAPSTALVLSPVQLPAGSGPAPYPSELAYLEDELRWIEARVRRIALAEKLRASDRPRPRLREALAERARLEAALRAHIDERLSRSAPRALDRMCEALGLGALERLVLLLACAPCCARKFEDIFALLDKDGVPNALTIEVVFQFAELSFSDRIRHRHLFGPQAPLVREDLIVVDLRQRAVAPRDLLAADIELTGRAFAYMLGEPGLTDELAALASIEAPLARLDEVVLPADDRHRIQAVIDNHDAYLARRAAWGLDEVVRYGRGALLLFYGPPGTGKTMTAHGVAHRLGRRLLNVDVPTFLAHEEAGRFLPGLFREARLQDAVLFFDECETLLGSRAAGNALLTVLLTELERFDGIAVLATNNPGQLDHAIARRVLVRVRFRPPAAEARAAIWRRHLPPTVPLADDVDLDALAARYPLSGGDIKNAVLAAVAEALYDGSPDQLGPQHLDRAARAQLSRPTTAPLQAPRRTLEDLIFPPALHRRLTGVAGAVSADERVLLVLSGPRGCGKTATAEALAGSLGRPLLPASPGNLAARIAEATRQRAVLHIEGLDEALPDPALLRSLTELPGLAVVESLDPHQLPDALRARSLHVPLPHPDEEARAALWASLLPKEATVTVSILKKHRLTGGQIAQVLSALRSTGTPLTTETIQAQIQQRPQPVGFR